jgi:thymidylate kinase
LLVICEGTDGSGKTTLANTLAIMTRGKYLHAGPPKRHPLVEYTEPLSSYAPGTGQDLICDRWHVGELVYGPLYRGRSGLTHNQFRAVEDLLREKGALLVLCDEPIGVLVERLTARGEQPNADDLTREAVVFHDVFGRSALPKAVFDGSVRKVISMGRTCEEYAVARRTAA